MKSCRAWAEALAGESPHGDVEVVRAQSGENTVRVRGAFLHSRYNPREEASRLLDDAVLDPAKRHVVVIGIGCGYHVQELLARGYHVAIVEPDRHVAKIALSGPLATSDALMHIGEPDHLLNDEPYRQFTEQSPQLFVHPPTERLYPEYVARVCQNTARLRLGARKPGIAVVGPMYGGSLPIASYLARAFEAMGHRTAFIDTSDAWPLYQKMTESVNSKNASSQLTTLFANVIEQWSYARVSEFAPNICIVMAQAPVRASFPQRLHKEKIISAYWFVENWRHMPYWREICREYDCFFHIQPGEFEGLLQEAGCPQQLFVPTACDPSVHAPITLSSEELEEFGCDVAFAGAGYNNRVQFLQGLTDYRLKIWGTEWYSRELQPYLCNPEVRFTAETFRRIVAGAAINLNLHSSATHSGIDPNCDAVNPRVFEIAACGGFQISDPCKGLSDFFDFQTELPVYRDLRKCRGLIDHYLKAADERRAIATNARARVLKEHTYMHRAERMLDCLLSSHSDVMLEKGIRAHRTVAEVAGMEGTSPLLARYLSSLPPDTPFSQSALGAHIPTMGKQLSHPEGIFAYLRELRTSAEQLLRIFDGA